jgi:hypothetical protein
MLSRVASAEDRRLAKRLPEGGTTREGVDMVSGIGIVRFKGQDLLCKTRCKIWGSGGKVALYSFDERNTDGTPDKSSIERRKKWVMWR